MRSPVPTAQLHRRPVTRSLNTRTAQEVLPQPLSDSVPRSPAYSHSTPHGSQPSQNTHSCDRSSCSSPSISPAAPCQVECFTCSVSVWNRCHVGFLFGMFCHLAISQSEGRIVFIPLSQMLQCCLLGAVYLMSFGSKKVLYKQAGGIDVESEIGWLVGQFDTRLRERLQSVHWYFVFKLSGKPAVTLSS